MNKVRVLPIAAVIAFVSAMGMAQAATEAKPAADAAAATSATAPAPVETKKAMTGKKHRKHHAKKKAAHAS